MRSQRLACSAAVAALLLAACGNRMPPRPIVLGQGQVADGSGTGTLPPGVDGGGSLPGDTPGGAGPGGGSGGPGTGPGASSCAGVATGAPGVTATTIKVGTIVANSGPLPGQFFQMTQAVSAYFQKINEQGGVCGRRLQLVVQDDGLNADKHVQAAIKLVDEEKVFAIVGMLTAVDKASARFLCDRGVPDVGGFALSYNRAQGEDCPKGKPPVYWSPIGGLHRNLIGDGQYFDIIKARALKHGAVMYHSTLDISKDQGLAQQWALNHAYCRIVEADDSKCDVPISRQNKAFAPDPQLYDVNPVQPDSAYDPMVLSMIDGRVDSVFTSMEINSNIKLLRAINRYRTSWRQRIGKDPAIYFQLSAYDAKLVNEAGSLARGVFTWLPHLPFTEPTHPVMADYLSTLKRYFPKAIPSSFGAQGWAGATLFVEALTLAGATLTRTSLRQALDSFTSYTANGFVGPLTPRERVIFNCGILVRVEASGGKLDFFRWKPPAGFDCHELKPWR